MSTRLNKFIASSGAASRRRADQWIQEGRVMVNGKITTNPATQVQSYDSVLLEGKKIRPKTFQTILLNKPRNFITSKRDEHQRPTIYHLLPQKWHHLNHVGRLDQDSEGLLILTNDGELAHQLAHPSRQTEKEYHVTVHEAFPNDIMDRLLEGVHTSEGKCQAAAVQRLSSRRLSITLHTGLKRQIRLMLEALHFKVTKLVRIRINSLTAPKLESGKYHLLDQEDITKLLTIPPVTKARVLRRKKRSPSQKPKENRN